MPNLVLKKQLWDIPGSRESQIILLDAPPIPRATNNTLEVAKDLFVKREQCLRPRIWLGRVFAI